MEHRAAVGLRLISLRSRAGVESTPGKQPNRKLEKHFRMSYVRLLNWVII